MAWRKYTRWSLRRSRVAGLAAALLTLALLAAPARATDVGTLQSRVAGARERAGALAGELQAKQAALLSAQRQAAAAAAREQQLSGMLAAGQQRSAQLGVKVEQAQGALEAERARLRRALRALSQRLVGIYKSGMPNTTDLVLGSDGFDDLVARADYLRIIENSDSELAARVKQVRDAVRFQLGVVEDLKARQDSYNTRLASARDQIDSVRARAESEASQLAAVRAARASTLNALQSNISGWVGEIEQAQQVSAAAAAETVGKWLGGPYSIPTSIVICESGGNYGAVNGSSGAGGAYQILPSTWGLYGGKGLPEAGSKQQQDQIASQIWADSGSGAWACAG